MKRAFLLCVVLAAAPFPAFAQGTTSAPLSRAREVIPVHDFVPNLK